MEILTERPLGGRGHVLVTPARGRITGVCERTPAARRVLLITIVVLSATASSAQEPARKAAAKKAEVVKPDAEARARIGKALAGANAAARAWPDNVPADLIADVAVFERSARMMDQFDEYAGRNDPAMVLGLLDESASREKALAEGDPVWTKANGSVLRGYPSKVDGSEQPYVVEVPAGLDRTKPARLDVVLHGRNDGMNEARFLWSHRSKKVPDDRSYLTLHVFGRGNNAYRWAGETDVFEAIEAVKRNYKVDDDRVVLRGFSMGGAGAWHIALHYPSPWCSAEAGAGFTETHRYARLENKALPEWRKKALTIYDSIDYARNAFDVPILGYGGEVDPQLQASTNIVDALKAEGVSFKTDGLVTTAEGLDFRRVVGKGMGHKIDPASQALIDAFHDEHARRGLDRTPKRIRFVTYTLAYNTAHWVSVERLAEHYKRATVDAALDGEVATIATANVADLGVDRQVAESVVIDGLKLPLRLAAKGLLPKVYYRKGPEGWTVLDHDPSIALIENADRQKSPGVQGPIDDAFRGPFLVVTPTGTAWHPESAAWSRARLDRFATAWRRHLRGDVPTKTDAQLTDEDMASFNLILFGDPGSNAVLAKVLKGLPIGWTRERFRLGPEYDAATHAPALIAPNPLNPRRYVVVNSGMTLEPSDFAGTNALLFPRLGDFAVFRLDGKAGEVVTSGYFDERWRTPR